MHKVAVYGSLRAGMGNHRLLESSKLLRKSFIPDMAMVSLGYFPAAFHEAGCSIVVEVYEVDDRTLERLDMLEGHPNFYRREEVTIDNEQVFVYVIQDKRYREGQQVTSGDWVEFKTAS